MHLDEILSRQLVTTCFQPIVDLSTARIAGYEALSRGPEGSEMHSPVNLIEAANAEGKLWELESLFRRNAIVSAGKQGLDALLFLNVDPQIITDPKFREGLTRRYLVDNSLSPERVVFEVTERATLGNSDTFVRTLDHYRCQGYQVAIDDTGAGYSNLSMLAMSNPTYIKIDMSIIRRIHENNYKQAIVKSLVGLANMTGAKVIAEGIETREEMLSLIRLGVHMGQGFYLAMPSVLLPQLDEATRSDILQMQSGLVTMYSYNTRFIGEIAERAASVDAAICCSLVRSHMEHFGLDGVCVVERNQIVGLVMRNHLNSALSTQYGYSLFSKKPISKLMDTACLVVDDAIPVNTVSELAMNRPADQLYDHIIVKHRTQYFGLVPVVKLLRHAIDIERSYALEMNPLTGLPGNVQINRVMHEVIRDRESKCVLYLDLDHFKAFNDSYGFEFGDMIIKMTKNVIVGVIKEVPHMISFIGHVGGDDFVVILQTGEMDATGICHRIMKHFDQELQTFLDGMECRLAWGIMPTAISIAGLHGDLSVYRTPEQLAMRLSEVKKKAKAIPGSCCILEHSISMEDEDLVTNAEPLGA